MPDLNISPEQLELFNEWQRLLDIGHPIGKSAPETLREINKIKIAMSDVVTKQMCQLNQKEYMSKIEEVKDSVNEIKLELTALPEKLIEKLDKRYADKKTEKTVDKVVWTILIIVITAVVYLVIKK